MLDLSDSKIWRKFIYKAFEISDFFSLTNYDWCNNERLNYEYNCLTESLKDHEINIKELPGSVYGEYKISYFKCNYFTMERILTIPNIREMIYPKFPEDICFYKDNKMWFESITHDEYWEICERVVKLNEERL